MPSLVNKLLFNPPRTTVYRIPSKIFTLRTSLGHRIGVTHIRKNGANVTILFSHGNAEDLNTAYSWMKKLSKNLSVNVIGYDYTGYGYSNTSPGERKCYADIETIYQYMIQIVGLTPEQIVLYGRSVGSGPSCYLAAKTAIEGRSVGGLILHSPFTSVYRVVFGPSAPTLLGDKFVNVDRLVRVQCPVFIIHGQQDKIVPIEHGEKLYETVPAKFRARPFFPQDMSHNYHSYEVEAAMMKELNAYLDYHILARQLWMNYEPNRSSTKSI